MKVESGILLLAIGIASTGRSLVAPVVFATAYNLNKPCPDAGDDITTNGVGWRANFLKTLRNKSKRSTLRHNASSRTLQTSIPELTVVAGIDCVTGECGVCEGDCDDDSQCIGEGVSLQQYIHMYIILCYVAFIF